MVNVARKREWKLASDIFLTESFLSESFLTIFSQVEIPLNPTTYGDLEGISYGNEREEMDAGFRIGANKYKKRNSLSS